MKRLPAATLQRIAALEAIVERLTGVSADDALAKFAHDRKLERARDERDEDESFND